MMMKRGGGGEKKKVNAEWREGERERERQLNREEKEVKSGGRSENNTKREEKRRGEEITYKTILITSPALPLPSLPPFYRTNNFSDLIPKRVFS